MNLILFEADELERPLPAGDRRTEHLLRVLKAKPGDSFDLGVVNGPRGKGAVVSIGSTGITWRAELGTEVPDLYPITLIVGAVRPPAVRRILKEAATLGLEQIWVFAAEKGEDSYIKSRVWEPETVRRLFIEGAEQGFSTRLPGFRIFTSLADALAGLPEGTAGAGADNYEAERRLTDWKLQPPAALAVGPERGWSAAERDTLRGAGFTLVSLGDRVLRTDTAVIAATALILSNLGCW